MTKTHTISPARLTIDRACELVEGGYTLHLGDKAVELITKCREYLDRKIESTTEPLYGITTGFGSLCNISIGTADPSTPSTFTKSVSSVPVVE